ncbi:MAG: transposase [Firmicutes bacterium]|nr:transposase [Bacillota bacterium]
MLPVRSGSRSDADRDGESASSPDPRKPCFSVGIGACHDAKLRGRLPLYRQEQYFQRLGIPPSRQTMANWMIESAKRWLVSLYRAMRRRLLQEEILHADETTVQVLHELNRSAQIQSHNWVYQTERDGLPIVLLDYQLTRSATIRKPFCPGSKATFTSTATAATIAYPTLPSWDAGRMPAGSSTRRSRCCRPRRARKGR